MCVRTVSIMQLYEYKNNRTARLNKVLYHLKVAHLTTLAHCHVSKHLMTSSDISTSSYIYIPVLDRVLYSHPKTTFYLSYLSILCYINLLLLLKK